MEERSRESSPEQDDIDFIVDDGYNHDDDPTYEPEYSSDEELKGVIKKKAKELGFKLSDYSTRESNHILSNIDEKLKSGFYLEKISIDADVVEAYKEKENIRLTFINCMLIYGKMVEDGGDYVSIYLPLPLRFDEEWFKKYREINLTVDTIENCHSEGYLKSDLKE